VKNDTYLIEREDIELAQDICNDIEDSETRNRAMANVIGANTAKNYFDDGDIDVRSGIHNIPQILRDTDISDIYIKDNYIDVRICFNENKLYVPKVHFDRGILPKAYMFLCLNEDGTSANVLGFALPEDISTSQSYNGYYKANPELLKSYYDVETLLNTVDDEGLSKNFTESVFSFLDGSLTNKKVFYSELISSKESRKYLKAASLADKIFKLVPDDFMNRPSQQSVETEASNSFEELPEYSDSVEVQDVLEDYTPDTVIETDDIDTSSSKSHGADEEIEEFVLENDLTEQNSLDIGIPENKTDDAVEQLVFESENETDSTTAEVSGDLDAEFMELSKFDYSTEVMPSISSIDTDDEEAEAEPVDTVTDLSAEDLEKSPEFEEFIPEYTAPQNTEETSEVIPDNTPEETAQEQLDDLFTENPSETVKPMPKKNSKLPLLGVLAVAGALGYFGYTKYFATMPDINNAPKQASVSENKATSESDSAVKQEEPAMPIETVENTEINSPKDSTVSVDIPNLEQNLTSIDISRLTVNWEVPASYTNNQTAKRYFLKIGKALQLNLKTELMVLSAPPIPNVLSAELEFNTSNDQFSVKRMVKSSGVERVDKVIISTINSILSMNLGVNMSVFKTLQGNPVIIIKL